MNQTQRKKSVAIVCLSKNGIQVGKQLMQTIENSTLFVPDNMYSGNMDSSLRCYKKNLRTLVPTLFSKNQNIIFVMAVGIVVRLIGPLAKNKKTDPAVVVVDERGRFAISLLSGHCGGANALAEKVAACTGGQAVITTASDIHKKPAIDMIADELEYHIENPSVVARFTRSFLDGEKVAIIDPLGQVRRHYKKEKNVRFFRSQETLAPSMRAALIVTNRTIRPNPSLLVIRPKNIVAGIGCKRGVTEKEIREAVEKGFAMAGVSLHSLLRVVTIDLKKDETGLLEYVQKKGVPIHFYSKEEINEKGKNQTGMNKRVFDLIGVPGVSEICAKLNTRRRKLLLHKITVQKRVTVALAEAISQ